jgi:acyl-CoA dehydrogenase
MLGERGRGLVVAQTWLGGGRVHRAMRAVGRAGRALEMMCERALSRRSDGGPLANWQLVQATICDSWLELEQLRLLVPRTAWRIDRYNDRRKVCADIAAMKIALQNVVHDVAAAGRASYDEVFPSRHLLQLREQALLQDRPQLDTVDQSCPSTI